MSTKFLNLILYRSAAELKSEGTRTYAGYLWWILEPLMSLAVYYVAFKYIFHRETENFAIFLFIGLVAYRFFAGSVTRSAMSIAGGRGLMQLIYFHKTVFPLSVVMVNLVKFLITMCLVMIITWLGGMTPTWAYLALPMLILLELLFISGVAMLCAAVTPFFPDFQMILNTILHLLIFLSGVFYDVATLPPKMQALIRLNPIAALIEQYRAVLIHGQWPNLMPLLQVLPISVLFIGIGWFFIHKFNRYYPKLG